MLYLTLLGRIRATLCPNSESIKLARQSATLLAFLALTRGQFHPREHLIERFWPERSAARGRTNLSSAAWRLRRSLPPDAGDVFSCDSLGGLGIDHNAEIWIDSQAFETQLTAACASHDGVLPVDALQRLFTALDLYRGEFMPGWYEDWVLAHREHLHTLLFRGRLRLLEHYAASGDIEAALGCGQELLKIDALRESLHRRLMRLYAENGEPAKIVSQYQMLTQILRSELGVTPAAQTERLFQSLITSTPKRLTG